MISPRGGEKAAGLQVDIAFAATTLHVFNLHLGTGFIERRRQARRLRNEQIFSLHGIRGPRIVLGDFNEWVRGSASELLTALFESCNIRRSLNRSGTYPGVFPILHLDHIYFDPALCLEKLTLWRDRTAIIASDHLPLVADFRIRLNNPSVN
jgi:endonuclease/exonuclease/phosphatase family metal-dependent hydrolase